MSIILGIIVPAILFIITLPLQSFLFLVRQNLKLKESKEKKRSKGSLEKTLNLSWGTTTLRSRLGLSQSKTKKSRSKLDSKVHQLSLKAMQALLKALSGLISLLRSVASSLIVIVIASVTVLLPICLAVIVGASSIIMFFDSEGSSMTYGDVVTSTNTNVVDSSTNATGWVGSVEKMANWYLKNVSTYQTSTSGSATGKRGWYSCDLLDNKKVGDDCTGFAYACLVYGGYISGSPTNAPSSRAYVASGGMVTKLQDAGFTHASVTADTTFQAGDILAVCGSTGHHVEIVVGVNDDGTYKTFGWGKIQSSYPSTASATGEKLTKKYTDYYRLSK